MNRPDPDRQTDRLDSLPDLEDVVAEYVDRLNGGERIKRDQVLAEQPYLGQEILEHLESFVDFAPGGDSATPLGTLGDYSLRRQIGRGGMGVVYEAWQQSMDRIVALKVLPPGIAADSKSFSRFLREAKTAGQLSHQNIVGVHSTGVEEGTPWYSMEFVQGETLAQILARIKDVEPESDTPFGRRDCAGYFENLALAFADVADGLQHAHSKGIVHRDIKPSNLILDSEGGLRVLDFGLARLEGQESLTLSGDLMGTVLYMSPEQAMAKRIPLDHRTDVYSLGATLYEMLTGAPPFRGKDQHDTLSQIIVRDPRPLRQLNPRVPKDLETVVLKCLRKDPGDRYGTAEALAQDLRRFVRRDAVEARPESRVDRFARRLFRARQRLAIVSLVVLLVISGTLIALRIGQDRRIDVEKEYRKDVLAALMTLQRAEFLLAINRPTDLAFLDSPLSSESVDFSVEEELRESASSLRAAGLLFPWRSEAHYYLARILTVLQDNDAALDAINAALGANPDFVPAVVFRNRLQAGSLSSLTRQENSVHDATGRGWRALWWDASVAIEEARWEDAAFAYTNLLATEARRGKTFFVGASMEIRLGRAAAYLSLEQYDQAVEDYVRTCAFWPYYIEPHLMHGQAYLLKARSEGSETSRASARHVFEELYSRDDGHWSRDEVAVLVSEIYRRTGWDLESALPWTERISDPVLRSLAAGCILVPLGDYAEAKEQFEVVLQRKKDDPFVLTRYGRCLGQLGDRHGALEFAERAVDLGPNRWVENFFHGVALREVGRHEEAAVALERAIRIRPDPVARYLRGWSFYDLERVEEAEACCRRALEDDPTHPHPRYLLGVIHQHRARLHRERGEVAQQQSELLKAEDAHQRSVDGHTRWIAITGIRRKILVWTTTGLGEVRRDLGKPREAMEAFVCAIELDPEMEQPHREFGWLLRSDLDPPPPPSVLTDLLRRLEKLLDVRSDSALVADSLAAILLARNDPGDAARALESTGRAVDLSERADPRLLLTLAEASLVAGRRHDFSRVIAEVGKLAEGNHGRLTTRLGELEDLMREGGQATGVGGLRLVFAPDAEPESREE